MEKELKELIKEAHKQVGDYLCWQEGCREIFGDPDIKDVRQAILDKGAEALVNSTTWLCASTTGNGYDEWVQEKVKWDKIPEELSKAAYLDVFRTQLTAMYLKEKAKEESNEKDVEK